LTHDLVAGLWTAERFPEERFVLSGIVAHKPGIRVPADSRLEYIIDTSPGSRLRTGVVGEGHGILEAAIRINGEKVHSIEVVSVVEPGVAEISWIDLDLNEWAGQAITLEFITEGEKEHVNGWWIMPQITSQSEWVLADPLPTDGAVNPVSYRFGDAVELVGYEVIPAPLEAGEMARVKLYWRPLQEVSDYAKVFVHLLDEEGELITQSDVQPVNNAYPIPFWQKRTTILDEHSLFIPEDAGSARYTLAVGLYDPLSLERWPVVGEDGTVIPERLVILPTTVEVIP
jgi:hypothetical protein